MNMVIPNEGKLEALNAELDSGTTPSEDWDVRLYSNNYTPVDGSTASDFTQATFTGYAAVTVSPGDWGAATIVSNVAVAVSSVTPTYTCTGGSSQTIYGWYAVGADSGKVRAAQKFDTARTMSTGATEALDPFQMKLKTFA